MEEGKWRAVGVELGVVGEGRRRKRQSSQEIKKGQKRGMKIARESKGDRYMKGIEEA